MLFLIVCQSVFAESAHWSSKVFKIKNFKKLDPCEISFISLVNGKIPADIMKTEKLNMWSQKFSAVEFVDSFTEITSKVEKIDAINQLKRLAYKDQDYIDNLSDITNELLRRRVFTAKELKEVMLQTTDVSQVRFYYSNKLKKFSGKVEIDSDKYTLLSRFVESQKLTRSMKKEYLNILMFSNRDANEFQYAINNGLKLRNDKKSLNQFKEYLEFIDASKKSQVKKAFRKIDEIYNFDYTYNLASYTSSSLLNPRKRFLIQKNRIQKYEKRRLQRLEKAFVKDNNGKKLSKAQKTRIVAQAKGEASIFNRLLNGCNGSGGKSLKTAAKKFSRFKLGLSLTMTPTFYYIKNADKLDKDNENFDRYWFERLGYEMGMSFVFTYIGNWIFLKSGNGFLRKVGGDFWGRYFEGYFLFGALDGVNAGIYDVMFGSKGYAAIVQKFYRPDLKNYVSEETPLEARYKELIKSPDFEKQLKKLNDFLEARSKDSNIKNFLNERLNLYTYKSGDDLTKITLEDLETKEGKEFMMELLAEKMYADNMGQWEEFQTGSTGGDRWLFYRVRNTAWDLKGLISNLAIFQIMCREPLGPRASWLLSLAIVGANELLSGPNYKFRREMINQ